MNLYFPHSLCEYFFSFLRVSSHFPSQCQPSRLDVSPNILRSVRLDHLLSLLRQRSGMISFLRRMVISSLRRYSRASRVRPIPIASPLPLRLFLWKNHDSSSMISPRQRSRSIHLWHHQDSWSCSISLSHSRKIHLFPYGISSRVPYIL